MFVSCFHPVLSAWDELSFLWGQVEISLWRSHLWSHIILFHSKPSSKQLLLCCTASLGVRAHFLSDMASDVKCSLHPSHLFLLFLSPSLPQLSLSCCLNLLSKQMLLLSMRAYIFPLKTKSFSLNVLLKVSSHVRVKYLWRVLFGSRALTNTRKAHCWDSIYFTPCYANVKCQEKVFIKWVI